MPLSRITNPFLSSSGSNNTSITSPAANTIAFTTSTAEDMRIDSSGNVGIGTSSISTKLTVGSGTVLVKNASGDSNGLRLYQDTSDTSRVYNFYSGPMAFGTNNTERMRIDSSGYVTTPYQPAFMVGFTSSGNVSLGDGVLIPFNDKTTGQCFDVTGSFNTSTSRFTAPVTGVYLFMVTISSATSGGYSVAMRKNGASIGNSVDTFAGFMHNGAGSTQDMITSLQVQLTSGDYIEVFTRNGAYSVYRNHSWFLGRLIG